MPVRHTSTLRARQCWSGQTQSAQSYRPTSFQDRPAPLFRHVRGGTVVVQPIWPLLEAPCEEMELRRVQIPGGWIHAQCVTVSGGRNALRRANRGGIEQQLRKEGRSVTGRCGARNTAKNFECWHIWGGWICWQVEHRHALVMTKRIGHVRPIERVRRTPQRFDTVLSRFVIFAPRHCWYMGWDCARGAGRRNKWEVV